MNQEKVIQELLEQYPGKQVTKNDIEDPTEMLCQIKATSDHPKYSLTIAVIDKSIPHYHKHATEEYSVIKGNLQLHIDHHTIPLHEGDTFIVQPNKVHWAEGDETWVSIFSEPGWTESDHVIVQEKLFKD